MLSEHIAITLHVLLGHNDVGGTGQRVHKDGVGLVQYALDRELIQHLHMVQHDQGDVLGLLGPLQGVLYVLGGHEAAVLVVAGVEMGVLAELEGVLQAVLADGPGGGQAGEVLALVVAVGDQGLGDLHDDT